MTVNYVRISELRRKSMLLYCHNSREKWALVTAPAKAKAGVIRRANTKRTNNDWMNGRCCYCHCQYHRLYCFRHLDQQQRVHLNWSMSCDFLQIEIHFVVNKIRNKWWTIEIASTFEYFSCLTRAAAISPCRRVFIMIWLLYSHNIDPPPPPPKQNIYRTNSGSIIRFVQKNYQRFCFSFYLADFGWFFFRSWFSGLSGMCHTKGMHWIIQIQTNTHTHINFIQHNVNNKYPEMLTFTRRLDTLRYDAMPCHAMWLRYDTIWWHSFPL